MVVDLLFLVMLFIIVLFVCFLPKRNCHLSFVAATDISMRSLMAKKNISSLLLRKNLSKASWGIDRKERLSVEQALVELYLHRSLYAQIRNPMEANNWSILDFKYPLHGDVCKIYAQGVNSIILVKSLSNSL